MALPEVKHFTEASVAAKRILERINRLPRIDAEDPTGIKLDGIHGEVEFDSVQFTYPSRPDTVVLKDFNLRVPAGETIALVGTSGSGKSTAVALLQRFYDVDVGTVRIDGVDIKKLQLKWLREKMGLVSQDHALFGTSIKENILFGKPDATMGEIYAAAMTANAHNFIRQLPEGYDTKVIECIPSRIYVGHAMFNKIHQQSETLFADWRARSTSIGRPEAADCHCQSYHQEPCYPSP